jgi:hypothetical protein
MIRANAGTADCCSTSALHQFLSLLGAVILHRPLNVVPQGVGSEKRPIRVTQELTRQNYNVRLA